MPSSRFNVQVVDEYQEIGDLLDRYATLKDSNEEARRQQDETDEESEKLRAKALAYTKQKTDEILQLNNQISQMKKKMEAYALESMDQEAKKDNSLQARDDAPYQQLESPPPPRPPPPPPPPSMLSIC